VGVNDEADLTRIMMARTVMMDLLFLPVSVQYQNALTAERVMARRNRNKAQALVFYR